LTPGQLVLVATPIGNLGDISARAIETLAAADIVCCEDTRHTGLLLKRLGIEAKRLTSLNAHNETDKGSWLVSEAANGATVALVSDAGTPAVSDPGERLVALAIAAGVRVTTVPGASAAMAALVVSGMSLRRWRFEGFLPRKGPERRRLLAGIAKADCPVVCYESPNRLRGTLDDLAEACGEDRALAVCQELTKMYERVFRGTVAESVEHFAAGTMRGEVVIVVGCAHDCGEGEGTSVDAAECRAEVDTLVGQGLSRRDAVRAVANRRGIPRSVVYEAAIGPARPR
jgi:16S rRNA (cytidine1402-2'-O)-methyltransferase